MFSCAVGREEHCKQISLMCGSARSVWTTLGLPQLTAVCAFCVYTTQAPGCSEGDLSKAGPGFRALPRSKLLRFRLSSTPQRLSCLHAFVPFPGPSSSGNQVLGEHTVPGGPWVLSPPPSWPLPGALQEYHLRCAMCLLWGADVSQPVSQEDMISNWEPTQFGGAAVSGAQIAPCLPTLAVARLPLCHQLGEDQSTAG